MYSELFVSIKQNNILDRFEVKQAKQLEKQNSAAELIKEREDTLVKGIITVREIKYLFHYL